MDEKTATAGDPPAVSAAPAVGDGHADVNAIAATLAQEAPEVQPHAVAQARAESQAQSDASVKTFDPAVHAAGPDGKGVLNAKGEYQRKRGRKAGSTSQTQSAGASRVGSGVVTPSKEQAARASGVGAANLFLVACVALGGEEWQPQLDAKTGMNEKAMLEQVFSDYFAATGKTDLPPGWALAAGITFYAVRRFTMPKTQSRLQRIKVWIGVKLHNWKMRKRSSTVQPIDGERDPRDKRVWGSDGTTPVGDRP